MTRVVVDPVTRVGGHLRVEAEVERRSRERRLGLGHVVPRDRVDPARPRCARRVAARPARVRDVHRRPRAGVGARGRERARAGDPQERAAGAQPDGGHDVRPGPRRSASTCASCPTGPTPPAALDADPAATSAFARSLSDWPNSGADYFAARAGHASRHWSSPAAGPFANGYWGHPAYRLPPETSLLLYGPLPRGARLAAPDRAHAHHPGRQEPAPADVPRRRHGHRARVGRADPAVAGEHPWRRARTRRRRSAPTGLADIDALLDDATRFVNKVFVPDVLAVAAHYPEWERSAGASATTCRSASSRPMTSDRAAAASCRAAG